MKALILGSKGNLGNEFLQLYKDKATGWDREELDVTDEAKVLEKITELKPGVVINCTAYNAVDKAEEDRSVADNINGYAVGFIAKACSSLNIPLVHFSSNYVFDGKKQEGYNEDDSANPISAYGMSKMLGEMELQKNTDKFYLVRSAWLYGKQGTSPASKKSFVDKMLDIAEKNSVIECAQDQFAQPTYTKDLAAAVGALISENKPYGIYHLTNSGSASWHAWAQEIFKIKNITVDLVPTSFKDFARLAKRPQYGILNNTKFIELRPWIEALGEYLQ